MFQEIERSVVAKVPGTGADVIATSASFAAVIDGATVSSPCRCCGRRAGALAADAIARVIETLDADSDLPHFLELVQRRLVRATADLDCAGDGWVASAAVYADSRREVWLIGDATALVNGHAYRMTKRVDQVAAEFRSVVDRAAIAAGSSHDDLRADDVGRSAIRPLLIRQHSFRNNLGAEDLAFAALGPEPTPVDLCGVVSVTRGAHRADTADGEGSTGEVVLASDGYPVLLPTLAASESALAGRLAADPLMIAEPPETKGVEPDAASFDDRAYLRLALI